MCALENVPRFQTFYVLRDAFKLVFVTIIMIVPSIVYAQNKDAEIKSAIQFQERFIQSIVPVEIYVPPVKEINDPYSLNEKYIKDVQKNLMSLFQPDKNQSPFEVKKYQSDPKIYVGYPSYLNPKIAPDMERIERENIRIKSGLIDLLRKDNIKNIKVVDNKEFANLFLLPVTSETYINISNPNVKVSPLRRDDYDNVLMSIKRTFFNQNIYQLNDAGLKGVFLSDSDGHIVISYCPVEVRADEKAIKENIFYCLIQSQGFPGFFRRHPKLDDDARSWGKKLVAAATCDLINPKQSIFDLDFAKIIQQCSLTKE